MNWLWKLIDWRMRMGGFDPKQFCGAGNVNWWLMRDIRKETAKLVAAGVPCYHIEAFGWGPQMGVNPLDEPERVCEKLSEVVFWCKRRRLALFVSVTNDNTGQVKHGNTDPRGLNQFRENVRVVERHMRKLWWKGMYVQPVGETQTAAGREIEMECAALFPKSHLVCNSSGGRPAGVPGWATYAAQHKARLADPVPRGHWDVTDHGTALGELGGTMAQDYRDEAVEADAHRAFLAGTPYVLYMFQQREMSRSDLEAVARGYRA